MLFQKSPITHHFHSHPNTHTRALEYSARWLLLREILQAFSEDLARVFSNFAGIFWNCEFIFWNVEGIFWSFGGIFWSFEDIFWRCFQILRTFCIFWNFEGLSSNWVIIFSTISFWKNSSISTFRGDHFLKLFFHRAHIWGNLFIPICSRWKIGIFFITFFDPFFPKTDHFARKTE